MELIAKVSRGSRMDQVYIPKNRSGLSTGSYVVIRPLETALEAEKPYFYNARELEPVKLKILEEVFRLIDQNLEKYDNVIITGSFLNKGFQFNDLDILLITEEKTDTAHFKTLIENATGIPTQILVLSQKALLQGLATDPLYQAMLSKCVAKKRMIYKAQRTINYQILDLHLLKSQTLLYNYDLLNGNEKYYLTRNMIAISLFLQNKKISPETIDQEILRQFRIKSEAIKKNTLEKKTFRKIYRRLYNETLSCILQHASESKQTTELAYRKPSQRHPAQNTRKSH